MKPLEAIRYYSNFLTDFEKTEILEYPEIYFIGLPTVTKVQGSPHLEFNFGYDDESGDYKY
jgi:dual specificity tyrosine-phosphorylation-regulated kinase 2/3/4